jgi:O-antigen ligase
MLMGTYILFDFGSIQGVFEWVNTFRLPFIVALVSVLYAFYLILKGEVNLRTLTAFSYSFLTFFIIIYAQISTIEHVEAKNLFTLLLQYWSNYIIINACIKKPTQYILILDIFLLAIVHSSFHAIHQGGKLYDSIWLRDENHVSLVCAFAIPFAFFLFMYYKSWLKKICYGIAIGFYVTANVIAMSRGGTMAMAAGAILCCLFLKHKIRAFIIISIATSLIFFLAPPKFFKEMDSIKQGSEESTAFDRTYGWHLAIMMFADHPLLGVGPSNYASHYPEYNFRYRLFAKRTPGRDPSLNRVAHSTPIQWLAEMGLIGIPIILLLQFALFSNWRIIGQYKRIVPDELKLSDGFLLFQYLTHANAIGQVVYWIGALFLSLLGYPFYWIFIPFSETCKVLFINQMEGQCNEE